MGDTFKLDIPAEGSTVERSCITIKRVSAGGGKVIERKVRRYIGDTHEQVMALIDEACIEFQHLDGFVADYNSEAR